MPEKVVIYARVNNPSQTHNEQIDACNKFALENDFEIGKIYQDTCSGNNKILVERFNEILKDMNNLGIKVMLTKESSRISRNDLIRFEIERKFKKYNKLIIPVTE